MTTLSTRPAPAILARLVKEVVVATGEVVPQNPPPFCAFCCVNTPKLLACSRCGESYCSSGHQKQNWKVHKRVCR